LAKLKTPSNLLFVALVYSFSKLVYYLYCNWYPGASALGFFAAAALDTFRDFCWPTLTGYTAWGTFLLILFLYAMKGLIVQLLEALFVLAKVICRKAVECWQSPRRAARRAAFQGMMDIGYMVAGSPEGRRALHDLEAMTTAMDAETS